VEDVYRVKVDLRRPHVLPVGMLQIPLTQLRRSSEDEASVLGTYMPAGAGDTEQSFVRNPRRLSGAETRVAEIIERPMRNSHDAVGALRRGDIDVIDLLLPRDAGDLANDTSIQVGRYRLPTIHLLIPRGDNPFLQNRTFRRALVYAINRKLILDRELLGGHRVEGCQVISGPFPVGLDDNDPLAYAYDRGVSPRGYFPRLAVILKALARREMVEAASSQGGEVPSTPRFVIGYPPNEMARIACQAIAQQMQIIGIEIELRELQDQDGRFDETSVDLVYRQAAVWEPLVDIYGLLTETTDGIDNDYVDMALRHVNAAGNWREARERLHELHRIVHDQITVIPLWQTVDRFAVSQRIRGIGELPLTLYQNVGDWTVANAER
jgi:ABC-type transport system substrate-binding protein